MKKNFFFFLKEYNCGLKTMAFTFLLVPNLIITKNTPFLKRGTVVCCTSPEYYTPHALRTTSAPGSYSGGILQWKLPLTWEISLLYPSVWIAFLLKTKSPGKKQPEIIIKDNKVPLSSVGLFYPSVILTKSLVSKNSETLQFQEGRLKSSKATVSPCSYLLDKHWIWLSLKLQFWKRIETS